MQRKNKGKKGYFKDASVRDNLLGKIRGHTPWLRDLEVSNFTPLRSQKGKSGQGDAVGLSSATQEQEGAFARPYPRPL